MVNVNNETLTIRSHKRQSMNVLSETKFQLDPKFFINEFDPYKDTTRNFNAESIDLNPIVIFECIILNFKFSNQL